jgi:hypothetical protein
LRHLHAAMDLFARRARQIKVRRIAEQMLHQRRAIHPVMRGAAPLILGPLPLLVLIENARAQRACFLMKQRRFRWRYCKSLFIEIIDAGS